MLGLEEPSVLGVYSRPATGSGRRGSSGTPLLTRGRASPASPVRPSETFAPVKFASLAAGVPSPTTFVSPDSKSVAGPFAPTVSPDANFVVYTRNARQDAACEPVDLADSRSLNKTTPTRVLSPSQHTLDDPNQPTTKRPLAVRWRSHRTARGATSAA